MSLETSTHIDYKPSSVVSFFKYLSATALFAVVGRFLIRHKTGENVDNDLNSLCEELTKRSGISFPGCYITGTKSGEGQSVVDSDGVAEFVITALPYIATLLIGSSIVWYLLSRKRLAMAV